MDKLREIIDEYEKDNDPLTQEEVDRARAELRHNRNGPAGADAAGAGE